MITNNARNINELTFLTCGLAEPFKEKHQTKNVKIYRIENKTAFHVFTSQSKFSHVGWSKRAVISAFITLNVLNICERKSTPSACLAG